ncbi:MAG: NTP transferase domain-containing protein [Chitinophagales bacterium]
MISSENKVSDTVRPPLYGLVLAGGKSKRMGFDKSAIQWHGKEQRYYMADLLASICTEVFISCRPEQQNKIDPQYKTLIDTYTMPGPYAAILSAFKENPNVAWLVVACDLPLLDLDTLQYLIQHRDTASIATTFKSPFDSLPEPLITIWEPASYTALLAFLSEGYSCPRKALIRSGDNVKILTAPDANTLMNVNTPEDLGKVKELLIQKN